MLSLELPSEILASVAARARDCRLREGLTQNALAERSGVSLGSLKRFERTGEISLKNLVDIAFALQVESGFDGLFVPQPFETLDQVMAGPRKRARGRRR